MHKSTQGSIRVRICASPAIKLGIVFDFELIQLPFLSFLLDLSNGEVLFVVVVVVHERKR